jgi:hypothetical protein
MSCACSPHPPSTANTAEALQHTTATATLPPPPLRPLDQAPSPARQPSANAYTPRLLLRRVLVHSVLPAYCARVLSPRPGLQFRLQYSLSLFLARDSSTATPTLCTWTLLLRRERVFITTGRPISETKRHARHGTRRNEPVNPPALHTPTSARTAAASRRTNHHQ